MVSQSLFLDRIDIETTLSTLFTPTLNAVNFYDAALKRAGIKGEIFPNLGEKAALFLNLIYPKFCLQRFIDPKFTYYLWQHLLTFDKSTYSHLWQENKSPKCHCLFLKKVCFCPNLPQVLLKAAVNGVSPA